MSERFPLKFGSKASFIPFLTKELGYFDDEGLDVEVLNKPEIKAFEAAGGTVDALVNWCQHAAFGAVNGKPLLGVMVLHDAPGVTIMVADRVKDEITSAADFAGRRIAEGASRSAKGILTSYLAAKNGLQPGSYTPVMSALDGRREAVTAGLNEGTVDVLTFMEPMTSYMKQTGLVSTLYDLSTRQATVDVLGVPMPAETLLVTPAFAEEQPEVVQKLVNAFLRTMAYLKTSSPQEVAAKLPEKFLPDKDAAGKAVVVGNRWVTIAEDYTFHDDEIQVLIEAIKSGAYDDTASGQARAQSRDADIDADSLYTNRFVEAALAANS